MTSFGSKDWFGITLLRYLANQSISIKMYQKSTFREDIPWIRQPNTMNDRVADGGNNGYCYNFLNIMWKVILQKHFTHNYMNESKSLWESHLHRKRRRCWATWWADRSKQIGAKCIPSYGKDKDNSLYPCYMGCYDYLFQHATSHSNLKLDKLSSVFLIWFKLGG